MSQQTRLLSLESVAGENLGEVSVESRILLNARAKKIADLHARLLDLSTEVMDGQVMIQGTLHKQIFFVAEDDRVHHQAEDVPFAFFVDVPGVTPAMTGHVQARIAKISHSLVDQQELSTRAIIQGFVRVTEPVRAQVVLDATGPLCRVEVLVGETTAVVPVEHISELERPAIKIRDVRVQLEEISAEVADDQVIFSGTLSRQIFFIATNNQEFHQEERTPFTGVAFVPGARPGMNVFIKPTLLRVDKFLTTATQVRQRATLSVFVRVTETAEVNVAEDPTRTGPLALCKRVVATASRQVLSETLTDLPVPAQKVSEIQARLGDVVTEVIPGKVIVTGTLHKQIFFVGPDDVVHHHAVDVPFTTFIDVPGAQPGMTAQVTGNVEHVSWHLLDPVTDDSIFRASEQAAPVVFSKLAKKTVVNIQVAVAEDQLIHVRTVPIQAAMPTAGVN